MYMHDIGKVPTDEEAETAFDQTCSPDITGVGASQVYIQLFLRYFIHDIDTFLT